MTKTQIKWTIVGSLAFLLLVFLYFSVKIRTVHGNQIGVKETWGGGVDEMPYQPRTYILFPSWTQEIYNYDTSSRVFTMNNTPTKHEKSYHGRETDSYRVTSADSQEMDISLNVRWRLDPTKVVGIHKTVRKDIEEKILRPAVMLIVKNEATMLRAIEAFSGTGLVKLQTDVQKDLMNPNGELSQRGIIVENFVIEEVKLDDKYVGEIRARQIATQAKLRADEETKASQALALKAQADARADFNKRVVEAERDKAVGVLKAEQESQKTIVAAEAEKRRTILAAEAEMESGVNRAKGIEAIGKAETDVIKWRLSAYAVPGADAYVKIEVSKNMAEAFKGIKGYLPENMKVNLLTESFMKSIENLMGQKPMPAK